MVTAMLPMLTRSIRIFFTRAQLQHKMRIVIPQHFVKIFDIFIIESLLLDCKTIIDMIAQCFTAAAAPLWTIRSCKMAWFALCWLYNKVKGAPAMNVTVYLGANYGTDPALQTTVAELGNGSVKGGHTLVYGGYCQRPDGCAGPQRKYAGGPVIGVEPQFFIDEGYELDGLTQLIVTQDMTERKAKMIELGDAFIAFPGGTGTLEEITEVMLESVLKHLDAPCILYNLNNYYDSLKALLDQHDRKPPSGLSTPARQADSRRGHAKSPCTPIRRISVGLILYHPMTHSWQGAFPQHREMRTATRDRPRFCPCHCQGEGLSLFFLIYAHRKLQPSLRQSKKIALNNLFYASGTLPRSKMPPLGHFFWTGTYHCTTD